MAKGQRNNQIFRPWALLQGSSSTRICCYLANEGSARIYASGREQPRKMDGHSSVYIHQCEETRTVSDSALQKGTYDKKQES